MCPARSNIGASRAAASPIVSSESESLILVDAGDQEIGTASKAFCHDGDGRLHRAFSLFLFDAQGALLMQQRASGKRLWPLYWSNSCCSHPRSGESNELAVERRMYEELGIRAEATYLYRFEYIARYHDIGSEHELCSVYAGRTTARPRVNQREIASWRWLEANELNAQLETSSDRFTPWFVLEWQQLTARFPEYLQPA